MARTPRIPQRPAFYARISRDRSGEQVGVKDQIATGRSHLAELGWPDPVIYQDNDISAASASRSRPGFERLLVDIEAGAVDGLAARHLDRLLRRVVDMGRLLDAIAARRDPFFAVTLVEGSEIDLSSASGRLIAKILASVAENESEVKGERILAARRREAYAGRAHGALGYGYGENQRIVPAEAAIIREVAQRILGGDSLRSIAVDLNDRGVPTPGAGRWDARRLRKTYGHGERRDVVALIDAARSSESVTAAKFARLLNGAGAADKWTAARVREHAWFEHLAAEGHGLDDSTIAQVLREADVPADPTRWRAANVRDMMRRGTLCGWRDFEVGGRGGNGEMVAQGDWTPILSKETVEEIRRVTSRPGTRGREPKHLLAGILRCGQCGSAMGGSPDGRGGNRYACSKQPGLSTRCGGVTITGAPVDRLVERTLIDALADADFRAGWKRTETPAGDVDDAEQELADIRALREQYAREAAAGGLTPVEWDAFRTGLDERQRKAEKTLRTWSPAAQLVLQEIPTRRADIEAMWDEATVARRRRLLQAFIASIPVSPSTERKGNRFDKSRIGEPVWRG